MTAMKWWKTIDVLSKFQQQWGTFQNSEIPSFEIQMEDMGPSGAKYALQE